MKPTYMLTLRGGRRIGGCLTSVTIEVIAHDRFEFERQLEGAVCFLDGRYEIHVGLAPRYHTPLDSQVLQVREAEANSKLGLWMNRKQNLSGVWA